MQRLSRRQTLALAFVGMLSPLLRLIPRRVADFAGSAAWVSPVFAFFILLALGAVLVRVLSAVPDHGLAQAGLRLLGPGAGKCFLMVWVLWFCFHAGFLLRSGADRFISTVFPDSGPWIFVVSMALLILIAGLGTVKTLARASELFRPVLLVVLLAVILLALAQVRPEFLLPVTTADLLPSIEGGVVVSNVGCFLLIIMAFLREDEESQTPLLRSYSRFLLVMCVTAAAVCLTTMGIFGKTLTIRLSHPFFVMVRDLTLFSVAQRFDALVIGLWVLPDFVLVTLEILLASDLLMLIFGGEKVPQRVLYWKDGNKFVWLCVVSAVIVAMVIAPDVESLMNWADFIVPAINLTLCFATPVLLFLVGKARKKI